MSIRDFVTSELEVTNSDFADELKQYTTYWAMLEDYLKLYDTKESNYQYHCQVAEMILSIDSRNKIPTFIVLFLRVSANRLISIDVLC